MEKHNMEEVLRICDSEPIHQLGFIQDHGYLIACSLEDLAVNYYSENFQTAAGSYLSKKTVWEMFADAGIIITEEQQQHLLQFAANENEMELFPLDVVVNGEDHFLLLAHKYNSQFIMELEPSDKISHAQLQQKIGEGVSEVLQANFTRQKLDNAVKYIKKIIGYDRVMVYRFAADGHGEVVAEETEPGIQSYMGLHFPAADIPRQARELYKKNLVRLIASVNSKTLRILSYNRDAPLDLTRAQTRAVSPVHIEYLKNMEVASSFSISLIVNNELWGLIACHNATPRFIGYKAREACKWLGRILSSSLEHRLNEQLKDRKKTKELEINKLFQAMQESESIKEGIKKNLPLLLDVADASGVAVCMENELILHGQTPTSAEIKTITDFITAHTREDIFVTKKLSDYLPHAGEFASVASGIMYLNLSVEFGEYMLWFKPEIAQSVNWAGNPEKIEYNTGNGITRISPRKSFATWTHEVKSIAKDWDSTETDMAALIKSYFIRATSQKAYQLLLLNEHLKRSYSELDSFSYTVSHDLKTPLMLIKNYAQLLQEPGNELTDENRKIVEKIVEGANRMNTLIHSILEYSRAGRFLEGKTKVEMNVLLQQIGEQLKEAYPHASPEIIIGHTPAVNGESTMLWQLFQNLLSNSVKYSSQAERPVIRVEGTKQKGSVLYTIADNGIGIDDSYAQQAFGLFRRSNNAKNFEGTGVGLSIAKRIVDKFGGRIWYESETGRGTTFFIEFPEA